MFYIKKLLTAIAIVFIVLVAVATSNRYLGSLWTDAILLILILIAIAFAMRLGLHKKGEIKVKIETADEEEELDDRFHSTMNFLQIYGTFTELSYMQTMKPAKEQPAYAQLTPAQQVMKSEESELRARLMETIRFRNSEEFKQWNEGRQAALCRQIGAMTLYHSTLIARCIQDGVLLKIDDSSSSDSSDSSSSCSSDSSSSDSSDSSSSDSSN